MLTIDQIILRLLVSAVISGIIGLEREFKHKPAGLRTNILVGVGSTLIMLVSIHSGTLFNVDPTRIAAGVITGIGFLGAGLIMRENSNEIHGITTAATIWFVAAMGLAIGIGFYSAAMFSVLIALLILLSSDEKLQSRFGRHK